MAVNSHITVGYDELAHGLRRVLFAVLVFVVFVCPQSTAFMCPRTSGWIGWWSPELLFALALKLLLFWESMKLMRIWGDINTKVRRVITMDETWIRSYTPELKQQSSKWKYTESHLLGRY